MIGQNFQNEVVSVELKAYWIQKEKYAWFYSGALAREARAAEHHG